MMRANTLKASIVAMPVRDFGGKKKRVQEDPNAGSEYETTEEHVETKNTGASGEIPAWLKQTVVLNLDKSLFQPFSLGDIKRVQSTPDNKAPSFEDTIEGRYANVLFTTASQKEALYEVYEDMMYL